MACARESASVRDKEGDRKITQPMEINEFLIFREYFMNFQSRVSENRPLATFLCGLCADFGYN